MTGKTRPRWFALAMLAPAGCPFCVAAGARVRTPRGEVAAGSLVVGDRVESIDVASGRVVEGVVVQVRRSLRECVALRWRGGELVCTPDHPLYSPERGDYRPASDWITGDARMLLARTGESVAEVAVETFEKFAGVCAVVDLGLAAEPRNFVAAGIVVHNKSLALEPSEMETVVAQGPGVALSATEGSRKFRVRICGPGNKDLPRTGTLWLEARSTAVPPPSGATPMWLAMYHGQGDEATFVDGEVPGALDSYIDSFYLPETTCSVGFVVGFERADDEPDGTIGVVWEARFEFFVSENLSDAPSLTIDDEE